jgi:PAS domain S-box-containing protein
MAVARVAWRYRDSGAGRALTVLAAATAWWSLAYLVSVSVTEAQVKLFAHQLMFPSIALAPVAWVVFAVEFTGVRSLRRREIAVLAVIPALGVLVMWTTAVHGLFWVSADLVTQGGMVLLATTKGPLFWLFAAYLYGLLAVGIGLMMWQVTRSVHVYRDQALALIVAVLLPWAGNALYLSGATGIWDLTNLALALSGVLLLGALGRHDIFELTPPARSELVGAMAEPVVVVDASGRVADLNDAAARLADADPAEAIGRDVAAVFSPVANLLADADAGQTSTEMSIRVDGEVRRFDAQITPYERRGTDTGGRFVTLRDVTERHRRERELRELTMFNEEVLHSTPLALFRLDEQFDVVYQNPAATDLLGRVETDDDNTIRQLLPAESDSLGLLADGGRTTVERELHGQNGEKTYVESTCVPLTYEDTVEGALLVVQDITDQHQYEERLKRQRDGLDVLTQLLSHDIRNDLQVIEGYASLLTEEDNLDTELVDRYGETIRESADDAIALTTSASEAAAVVRAERTELSPVDLCDVLDEEIERLDASSPGAVVERPTALHDVAVTADDMLGSVFRNLLKNAVQHGRSSEPTVRVGVTTTDEQVRVTVADDGPGIPDDRKAEIFRKGERGADSTGTGIGLYLVETLVERYGGDVSVGDADLGGAEFVVTLPRAE